MSEVESTQMMLLFILDKSVMNGMVIVERTYSLMWTLAHNGEIGILHIHSCHL